MDNVNIQAMSNEDKSMVEENIGYGDDKLIILTDLLAELTHVASTTVLGENHKSDDLIGSIAVTKFYLNLLAKRYGIAREALDIAEEGIYASMKDTAKKIQQNKAKEKSNEESVESES